MGSSHFLMSFQVDKAHPDVLTVMLQLFDEVAFILKFELKLLLLLLFF